MTSVSGTPGAGWPIRLSVNGWTGRPGAERSELDDRAALAWALSPQPDRPRTYLQPPPDADPADWNDPRVGWGLVLPDDDDLPPPDRATAADAPQPVQALVAARAPGPVLRYRPELGPTHVRRYYPDRPPQDLALSGSDRGTAPGRLPRYLLLYGTPARIPWSFQYALNSSCHVGRLHLTGAALERYVDALMSGWAASRAAPTSAVVWASDHGPSDITHLLRRTVADPVYDALREDDDIGAGARRSPPGDATAAGLARMLAEVRPALVVTTSHGMIGPPDQPAAMARDLGLPVADDYQTVRPEALLASWQPDGAIWYAHACCSAGSDGTGTLVDLFAPDSRVGRLLGALDRIPAGVAPLPTALLGARQPARAFVGQVEPTFDWTIRQPRTGQPLTASIRRAIYPGLVRPLPVGLALAECFEHVGELFGQWDLAVRAFDRAEDSREVLLACRLAARDRRSMVVLGDPTAVLPPLRPTGRPES